MRVVAGMKGGRGYNSGNPGYVAVVKVVLEREGDVVCRSLRVWAWVLIFNGSTDSHPTFRPDKRIWCLPLFQFLHFFNAEILLPWITVRKIRESKVSFLADKWPYGQVWHVQFLLPVLSESGKMGRTRHADIFWKVKLRDRVMVSTRK